MENKALAQKIVDKLSTITKHERPGEKEGAKPTPYYVCSLIDVASLQTTQVGNTKKEAADAAVKHIAEELDEGRLILSDSWAEDNLGA